MVSDVVLGQAPAGCLGPDEQLDGVAAGEARQVQLDVLRTLGHVRDDEHDVVVALTQEGQDPAVGWTQCLERADAEHRMAFAHLDQVAPQLGRRPERSAASDDDHVARRRERVGELVERTSDDLLNITNFGQKSLDEVIAKLDELGLSLADAPSGSGD